MDIFFSHYQLTPKHPFNHSSGTELRKGVFLKTNLIDHELADYFPHENLGDQSVEDFLESFPNKNNQYHMSILRQLQLKKSPLPNVPFFNHQLWLRGTKVDSPVVKYKIMSIDDEIPTDILKSQCRIRLDANGIFKEKELFKFFSRLSIQQIARIDYIEDPTSTSSWSDIPVPTASDFIESPTFETLIYKPNRMHKVSLEENTIFSGYMGHPLGQVHAYRELIKRGNLNLFHGLLTPALYENGPNLFHGNYLEGFLPDPQKIEESTAFLLDQQWSRLCSI
jgi:hypothetical protein